MTEPRWCQKIDSECDCALKHSDKYDRKGAILVRLTERVHGDEVASCEFQTLEEAKKQIPGLFKRINARNDGEKAVDAQIYEKSLTFICNVAIEETQK